MSAPPNHFQESLGSQLRKLAQDKEEAISKYRGEVDQLHTSLNERECNVASLNEKVAKLEASGKETRAKLEAAAKDVAKLSQDLDSKV